MTFAETKHTKSMGDFNYKQQYGVIVICENEKEQQEVYARLLAEGLKLKVVTV
jgi:hypothetical protein